MLNQVQRQYSSMQKHVWENGVIVNTHLEG